MNKNPEKSVSKEELELNEAGLQAYQKLSEIITNKIKIASQKPEIDFSTIRELSTEWEVLEGKLNANLYDENGTEKTSLDREWEQYLRLIMWFNRVEIEEVKIKTTIHKIINEIQRFKPAYLEIFKNDPNSLKKFFLLKKSYNKFLVLKDNFHSLSFEISNSKKLQLFRNKDWTQRFNFLLSKEFTNLVEQWFEEQDILDFVLQYNWYKTINYLNKTAWSELIAKWIDADFISAVVKSPDYLNKIAYLETLNAVQLANCDLDKLRKYLTENNWSDRCNKLLKRTWHNVSVSSKKGAKETNTTAIFPSETETQLSLLEKEATKINFRILTAEQINVLYDFILENHKLTNTELCQKLINYAPEIRKRFYNDFDKSKKSAGNIANKMLKQEENGKTYRPNASSLIIFSEAILITCPNLITMNVPHIGDNLPLQNNIKENENINPLTILILEKIQQAFYQPQTATI